MEIRCTSKDEPGDPAPLLLAELLDILREVEDAWRQVGAVEVVVVVMVLTVMVLMCDEDCFGPSRKAELATGEL